MTQDLELEKPQLEDVSAAMGERIDAVIAGESGRPGATIPVLRKCQDTVGYLPRPLIAYVAAGLGLPRAEVFGVATFYSLFTLAPRGRQVARLLGAAGAGTASRPAGGRLATAAASRK